jgi:outer membrane protein W
MNRFSRISLAVAAVTLLSGVAVQTQAASQHTVKLGYGYTDFDSESGDLYSTDPTLPTPAGITASVKNIDAAIFTYDYNFNENWSLELGLGLPPTVKLETQMAGMNLGEVGEATSFAPTVLAIYNFPLQNGFNVYAGLGINYTKFEDVEVYQNFSNIILQLSPVTIPSPFAEMTTSSGEIDDSVGVAFKLGASYDINEYWLVDLSYSFYDVTADITNTTIIPIPGLNPIVQKMSIDVNPHIYTFAVGYRF